MNPLALNETFARRPKNVGKVQRQPHREWCFTNKEPDMTRERLLCVDDEPLNLLLLEDLLGGQFDLETTQSGAEALSSLGNGRHYDLILLDVMMPGMDGFEVCRQIKAANPDHILHKPGRHTPENWEIMQRHADYGQAAITLAVRELGGNAEDFLRDARESGHCHHENGIAPVTRKVWSASRFRFPPTSWPWPMPMTRRRAHRRSREPVITPWHVA